MKQGEWKRCHWHGLGRLPWPGVAVMRTPLNVRQPAIREANWLISFLVRDINRSHINRPASLPEQTTPQRKSLLFSHWTSWAGRLPRQCDYSQRSSLSTPNLDIRMCESQHLCADCFSQKHSAVSEQEVDFHMVVSQLTMFSLSFVQGIWNWSLKDGAINF